MWQEDIWESFTRKYPEVPFTTDQLYTVLRVCPVHYCDLQSDVVPVVYGLIVFEDGYFEAQESEFPLANEISFGGCCIDASVTTKEADYCPACRASLKRWVNQKENRDTDVATNTA